MKKLIVSAALSASLVLASPHPAVAMEVSRVDVQYDVCSSQAAHTDLLGVEAALNDIAFGPLHKPLVLVLPDGHPRMEIALVVTDGIGFVQDAADAVDTDAATTLVGALASLLSGATSGYADPSVRVSRFSVSLYGYEEDFIWGEADAIPRGDDLRDRRVFEVGPDVRYITVYSWYDLGPGEVFKAAPLPSSVYYEGARPLE